MTARTKPGPSAETRAAPAGRLEFELAAGPDARHVPKMDTMPATVPPATNPGGDNPGETPNAKPPRIRGIEQVTQAANIQRFAYDSTMALKETLTTDGKLTIDRETASAIAQLVRSWDIAREATRILRGKGLPAAVKSKGRRDRSKAEPEIIAAPFVVVEEKTATKPA